MALYIMWQARRKFPEVEGADVGLQQGCSTGVRESVTGVCLNLSQPMQRVKCLAGCIPVVLLLAALLDAVE